MWRLARVLAVVGMAVGMPLAAQVVISGQVNYQGNAVPFAPIQICVVTSTGTPCTPTAAIYYDFNLSIRAPNPTTADQNGNYTFYAANLPAPSYYVVQVTPVPNTTWSYVVSGVGSTQGCTSANSVANGCTGSGSFTPTMLLQSGATPTSPLQSSGITVSGSGSGQTVTFPGTVAAGTSAIPIANQHFEAGGYPSSCSGGSTQLDCAIQAALPYLSTQDVTLRLGSGTYTTNGVVLASSSLLTNHSIKLIGDGKNATTIKLISSNANGAVYCPKVAGSYGSYSKNLTIQGMTIDANFLSPYALNVQCFNGDSHFSDYRLIGATTSYELYGVNGDLDTWTYQGNWNDWVEGYQGQYGAPVYGRGAAIAVSTSGGVPTLTIGGTVSISSQSPGSGYIGTSGCAPSGGIYQVPLQCTAVSNGSGGIVFSIVYPGIYTSISGLTLVPTGFSGGTGASATLAMTPGGSLYTSNSQIFLVGSMNGTNNVPCSVIGTTSITIPSPSNPLSPSGGNITAASASGFSGCVDPVYAWIYDGPSTTYGFDGEMLTDSSMVGGTFSYSKLGGQLLKGGNNKLFGQHYQNYGQWGLISQSKNQIYGTNCGEMFNGCFNLSGGQALITDTGLSVGIPVPYYAVYNLDFSSFNYKLDGLNCTPHVLANEAQTVTAANVVWSSNTARGNNNYFNMLQYCGVTGNGSTLTYYPQNIDYSNQVQTQTINYTGQLLGNNPNISAGLVVGDFLAPNNTTPGNITALHVGTDDTNSYNKAKWNFVYQANASNTNYQSWGFTNATNLMALFGTGHFAVGSTTDCGQFICANGMQSNSGNDLYLTPASGKQVYLGGTIAAPYFVFDASNDVIPFADNLIALGSTSHYYKEVDAYTVKAKTGFTLPTTGTGCVSYAGVSCVNLGGQIGSIGTTAMYTPAACTSPACQFVLRLTAFTQVAGTGTSCAVTFSISANNGVTGVAYTSSSLSLLSTTTPIQNTFNLSVGANQAISYSASTTGTGCSGFQYALQLSLVQEQ